MTVDENTIRETLSAFGDSATKLVELTLIDADRLYQEIEGAIENDDAEAGRLAAHSMKSIMKQIGVHSVSEVAQKMERFGKDGNMQPYANLWDDLSASYIPARKYLSEYLD